MKITTSLISLCLLMTVSLWAQKQTFTLDDVVNGGKNYSQLRPESLNKLMWATNNSFTYVDNDTTMVMQTVNGKKSTLFTLSQLQAIAPEYTGKRLPYYRWHNGQVIQFFLYNQHLFYDYTTAKTWSIKLPETARNADLCFDKKQIAYTIDNNVYYATPDNEQTSITKEESSDIVCGQTVHRNEFGIMKGTYWSKDGNNLAFYRKDESMVEDYPLVDILAREGKAKLIKYPMAGMASHEIKVGIYNMASEKTVYLNTGAPYDRYFTNISWAPDNKHIYIAELNRGQDTMNLNCYNATTGELVKTLFTETDEQYVEPQHALLFLPNNPQQFIWQTQRNGYNHLYLYNTDGTLLEQLTDGEWEVTDVLGFDSKAKNLLITTTEKSYIDRHTYVLNIAKKIRKSLTTNSGMHRSQMSKDGKYILDTWSNVETPLVSDLIATRTGKKTNLFTAENPYADYDLGEVKLFTLKADDDTELQCRMILPPNFDANKTYPTIVYVYGGPHAQLIQNRWKGGAQMWQYYMAQKGYIMFTLDNRGTPYRGADFEQIIHRQLGKTEMKDQMLGYDYLTQLEYVDKERMGVFGWSFGGFMTTSLMTQYPDAFKVGVAGGPVIDWSNYEIMYGERYMDSPQENPEGYEACKVTNYAKDLKGRLLMIHGAQDPVVVWQHSQKFVRQCVEDGVQLDYFVYPTHEHNVRGKDRVHLMDKITRHFDDFL